MKLKLLAILKSMAFNTALCDDKPQGYRSLEYGLHLPHLAVGTLFEGWLPVIIRQHCQMYISYPLTSLHQRVGTPSAVLCILMCYNYLTKGDHTLQTIQVKGN